MWTTWDLKARQPGKILSGTSLSGDCPTREEGWVRRKMRIEANSEITLDDIHREIATLYGTKHSVAVNYRLLGTAPHDLELSLKSNPMSTLNIGFRFDSEEMAAILLNTTFNNRSLRRGHSWHNRTLEQESLREVGNIHWKIPLLARVQPRLHVPLQ